MSEQSIDPNAMAEILQAIQQPAVVTPSSSFPRRPESEPLGPLPPLAEIVEQTIADLNEPVLSGTAGADEYGECGAFDLRVGRGVGVLAVLANTRFYEGNPRPKQGDFQRLVRHGVSTPLARTFTTPNKGRLRIVGACVSLPSHALDMPVRRWAFEYMPPSQRTVQEIIDRLAIKDRDGCHKPEARHYRIDRWIFDDVGTATPMLFEEGRPEPHDARGVAHVLEQLHTAKPISLGLEWIDNKHSKHMFNWE